MNAERTIDNNNTKDQASHSKQTSQVTKDQQENERITGDIFYPFSLEHPTPKIIYTTRVTPTFVYKIRPKYIHTKLSLRQIHKLDDKYDSLQKHNTVSQANQQRLNEINKITEQWEQQDTHITKRQNTQTTKPQQFPQQQQPKQHHHRKPTNHEQIQTTSYVQWTQHKEQKKQQTRQQQIRLLDADYHQRMTTKNEANNTLQQQLPTKSVWNINTDIATARKHYVK